MSREEIYKVTIESYKELNAYISKNVLGDTFHGTQKLTYVDSDGDVVVIKCEKDFEEAASENAGKVLKLNVEKSPSLFSPNVLINDDNPMIVEIDEYMNAEPPNHEPPVAKNAKYDLPKLETACRDLSSQHEKIYGVSCHLQVSEKKGDVFVHCLFCKTDIKLQKGKRVYTLQPYIEHKCPVCLQQECLDIGKVWGFRAERNYSTMFFRGYSSQCVSCSEKQG